MFSFLHTFSRADFAIVNVVNWPTSAAELACWGEALGRNSGAAPDEVEDDFGVVPFVTPGSVEGIVGGVIRSSLSLLPKPGSRLSVSTVLELRGNVVASATTGTP